jgi:4-alpha-glucanotransferase
MSSRLAGLLVPLFSIPSTRSWGIGELSDIVPLGAWMRAAGLNLLQVLPLNEMAAGGRSP